MCYNDCKKENPFVNVTPLYVNCFHITLIVFNTETILMEVAVTKFYYKNSLLYFRNSSYSCFNIIQPNSYEPKKNHIIQN